MIPRLMGAHLLVLVCLAQPALAQTKLRWNLQPGQSLGVSSQQTTSMTTTVNKRPLVMTIEMGMEIHWTVGEVDEQGIADVTQSFERITLSMKSPKQPAIEFDSSKPVPPEAKATAASIMPIIGKPFQLRLDQRGQVVDVKLPAETKKAVDSLPKGKRLPVLSKEGVRGLLQQSFTTPAEPVDEGKVWRTVRAFDASVGKMSQTTEYKYQGVKKRGGKMLHRVDVSGGMKPTDATAKTKIKSQSIVGELWFDAEQGRLSESKIDLDMTTERPYRNDVIRVVTKSSVTMKIENR